MSDKETEVSVLCASIIDWWNNEPHIRTLAQGILTPWSDEDDSDDIPFKIVTNQAANDKGRYTEAIRIMFKGYGEKCATDGHGSPILIEIHDGRIRVVLWSDINHEDYTHAIDLGDALESKRNEG